MSGDAAQSALREAILRARDRIAQYRGKRISEQDTKGALIDPILRALGWDTEELDEVRREYRHTSRSNPADYALMLLRKPKLFVEAKALGENLGDEKWAAQVISYAATAGVPWVALTDGDAYRIYNALARVDIEGKLFRSAHLSADVEAAVEALSHLSKVEIGADSLDTRWNQEQADRRVREAVEEMFSPPADWVLRGLDRRLDGLAKGEIRAALSRLVINLDSAREQSSGGNDEPKPEPPPRLRPPREQTVGRRGRSSEVSIADLIRAEMLPAPTTLRKRYSGHDLEATVTSDGSVVFEGKTYGSPSMAAAAARHSVKGPPAKGTIWHTNGWTFWSITDPAGQRVLLDDLRRRLLAAKKI